MSGSEIAFFSLTEQQIEDIDDENKRSQIEHILSNPEKLLATILIGNNLVNVMIVVLSTFAMAQMVQFNNGILSFLIQTVILTFLILLFGEILPKLYANNYNTKFATMAISTLNTIQRILNPLSSIMEKSTFIVNKMVTKHTEDISMDDLSKALEISDVKAKDEKELLKGILTFGGKEVSEIMRPRIDVVDLDYSAPFNDVVKTVIESGYSRIPVFQDTPDNVKGILYAKDLLPYIGKQGNDFNWQRLLREAFFVPETRMIDDLLEDFRKKSVHFAIVVDEFGCTQGIATLEDVLEEIVGDIDDEYDTEEKFYTKISDNTYVFDGKTLLGNFYRVTGVEEEEFGENAENIETLAGLLLNIKGDFPKEKEPIAYGRCKFLVLDVVKHRIEKVRVSIIPK
ncbi:MAG: gliding motility-associated protein GldE [Bacteroidales bacterium]|nr:gliding motility-associated protein GldE [Bacteroidales bacterium]